MLLKQIPRELHEKRSAAGRKGGYATLFKYGRERMRDWGSTGGRPRLKSLAEMDSQFGVPEQIREERIYRLPGVESLHFTRGALNLKERRTGSRRPACRPSPRGGER